MYAKLFTSIYQGTLRGNSHGLLVFTNLLAHCDKNGVADIHPRAIAEEVGLTVEQVRVALDVLEAPDDESRSPEEQGRRIVRLDEHRAWGWLVVNYVKYRAIRNEDDRREQNREAQERFRQKRKPPSAAVRHDQPQSAHTEAEAEAYTEKKTARKRASPSAPVPPEDVSAEVWESWLELRKKKRAPVTATVIELSRHEAMKANLTLEAFLRVWCFRGSQGLMADWLKPEERGRAAVVTVDRSAEVEAEIAAREREDAKWKNRSPEQIESANRARLAAVQAIKRVG